MARKVKVKGHSRAVPAPGNGALDAKMRHPRPPFKKGKGGYFAHGVVKETREGEDGKSMHVTIRHGYLSSYDRESRLHLPMDAAKKFPMGQGVTMHVRRRSAGPDTTP